MLKINRFRFRSYFISRVGIGNLFGFLVLSYAKNYSLEVYLFTYVIIMGFVLTEVINLFGLMMVFKILYG